MTERLPTPGDDFDAWGDILNGFLGVSHNDDGTEKLPGASYLIATDAFAQGLTSGTEYPCVFTVADSAGSDIALDPDNLGQVDFLSDGWYGFSWQFSVSSAGADRIIAGVVAPDSVDCAFYEGTFSSSASAWQDNIARPFFLAGPSKTITNLTFTLFCDSHDPDNAWTNEGSIRAGIGGLIVVRLA